MDTTEVRERVPEDLLERIRLLTMQAELIDRDVEALARAFWQLERDYEDVDATLEPNDADRMDRELMDACGHKHLRMLIGAMQRRLTEAISGSYYPDTLRSEGFAGFGIDQEVSA